MEISQQQINIRALAGTLGLYGLIIALLFIIGFTTPNPPYEIPPGGLEIALGEPYMGGPDDSPSSLAGDPGEQANSDASSSSSEPDNTITEQSTDPSDLPQISQPKVDRPTTVVQPKPPSLDKETQDAINSLKTRKKGGSGGDGGTGSSPGPGGDSRGTGSGDVPGTQGNPNGVIGKWGFIGTKPSCNASNLDAEGEGKLKIMLKIDCNGNILDVVDYNATGTTYNGTDYEKVGKFLIARLHFTAVKDCEGPQTSFITFNLYKGM